MAELSLQDLWHACAGSGELRLLVEHPGQPPRGVVVETPFALVGASDLGAVVLPDEHVSRRHACLQMIGGKLWGFDLVSRTGTFWGNRRKTAGWFNAAESLRIGPYQLRVFPDRNLAEADVVEQKPRSPFKPIPFDEDHLPSATLEFLNAQRAGSVRVPTFHLDRTLTLVGQSPRCKIRFTCPTISTCHCSLLRTPQGIWVIDLQSREGVSINGAKVRWAKLRDGDCLGIGRFEVRVNLVPRRVESTSNTSPMEAPAARTTLPAEPRPAESTLSQPAEPSAPALNHVASSFGLPNAMLSSSALTKTAPASSALATFCPENTALTPAKVSALGLAAGSGNDPTQTLLLTFFNQFSMMQQQMFDQFQQTTMMMMQMFGTLHRDQLQLVRQELDGLRDLNREIVGLQAELAKHQAEGRAGRRPATPTTGSKPAAPRAFSPNASVPGPSAANPAAASTTNPASPKPAAESKAAAAAAASATPADDDVHAWLTQRFNHLQQESQSRWQKLLATVVGH